MSTNINAIPIPYFDEDMNYNAPIWIQPEEYCKGIIYLFKSFPSIFTNISLAPTEKFDLQPVDLDDDDENFIDENPLIGILFFCSP